jgi:hypothetical protein
MEHRLALTSNRFADAIRRNTTSLHHAGPAWASRPRKTWSPAGHAMIDRRLPPAQSHTEFIEWLRKTAAEPKLKIEIVQHKPSAPPSPPIRVVPADRATVERHSPKAKPRLPVALRH